MLKIEEKNHHVEEEEKESEFLIDYLTQSDIEDSALLIHCLLNRVPIIIVSEDEQKIENFINDLPSLIAFRTTMIFYTDFIEPEDYISLIENEQMDYETQRNIYLCYPFAVEKILKELKEAHGYYSWIIGCLESDVNTLMLFEQLYNTTEFFLRVILDKRTFKTMLEGNTFPHINLDFEYWLIRDAIQRTEISIEKMKRIISKQVKSKKMSKEQFNELMDFTSEERDLKKNLMRKEILDFYEAAKRAFNILNRFSILQDFGFYTKISTKTLTSIISYKAAKLTRILSFIDAEWNAKYEPYIEMKKISNFTDTFESLWG